MAQGGAMAVAAVRVPAAKEQQLSAAVFNSSEGAGEKSAETGLSPLGRNEQRLVQGQRREREMMLMWSQWGEKEVFCPHAVLKGTENPPNFSQPMRCTNLNRRNAPLLVI